MVKEDRLFNSHEKAVVVSLLIEMVNADRNVAFEEMVETNNIFARLHVDKETFELGRALDVKYAMHAARSMSDDQKLELASLLVELIDADHEVADTELALLKQICTDADITEVLKRKGAV